MFSIVTVASSTRMPTASARPPSVMMFSVSPIADRQMIAPSVSLQTLGLLDALDSKVEAFVMRPRPPDIACGKARNEID